jgi:hypothetical protein
MQVIDFLKENGETEALAALKCPNVSRLNEVMVIFTQFIKSVEENFVSHFDTCAMLQKLIANLGSLRANRHAEILIKAVSGRFSRTTGLNIIFTCFLVTPVGKRCYGAVPRRSAFAACMETMWNQGLATLATAFSYDIAQTTSLFGHYLDNPLEFGSVKDSYSNYQRCVSVSGRQIDTRPFVDLVKRMEVFPATECACERRLCQLRNLASDFQHQMSGSMIVDLW